MNVGGAWPHARTILAVRLDGMGAIPLRAAYCRENPYTLLTHWLPDPDKDAASGVRHEVARQIALVESVGAAVHDERLQFPVREQARDEMLRKVRAAGMRTDRPWLVVHPGATASSRRYPPAQFAVAVSALVETGRWQIAVAGSDADIASANLIAEAAADVVVLAGLLELPELAALLQAAQVFVCNNSVAAHPCAAVGTPLVDL